MNIVGITLGPVLAGYVMDQYEDEREGMKMGYRAIMMATVVFLILYITARAIVDKFLAKRVKKVK